MLRLVLDPAKVSPTRDGADESAYADSALPCPAGSRESSPGHSEESANADSVRGRVNPDDLAHGLIRLGLPAGRSRRLIDAAIKALPRAELTESNVLRTAIRSI